MTELVLYDLTYANVIIFKFFSEFLDWVHGHSTAELNLVTPIWNYFSQ